VDIPVIVRCVPPAVPPLAGVTVMILTMWIKKLKKLAMVAKRLRRRRLLGDTSK
jgi:hypothetical protein